MSIEQFPRNSQTFEQAQLLVKDFDGTVAQTFDKSPSGIGVNEAYEIAIDHLFGPKAIDEYRASGGLKNRAPREVVEQCAPELSGTELENVVRALIDDKLNALKGEIGTRFKDGSVWPRPMPGYLEFLELLTDARTEGRYVDDLILSSGHVSFIEEVYRAWSVSQPTHIVAEETMEALHLGNHVKPSSVLMSVAFRIWQNDYGFNDRYGSEPAVAQRTLYVGDDVVKDGQLAENSGVSFFHITPETSVSTWREVAQRLRIGTEVLHDAPQ